MNKIKSVSAILLILVMVFSFVSCGESDEKTKSSSSQNVSSSQTSETSAVETSSSETQASESQSSETAEKETEETKKDTKKSSKSPETVSKIDCKTMGELVEDESFKDMQKDLNKSLEDMMKLTIKAESDSKILLRFKFVREFDKDIKKNIESKMQTTLEPYIKTILNSIKNITEIKNPVVHMLMVDKKGTILFDKEYK